MAYCTPALGVFARDRGHNSNGWVNHPASGRQFGDQIPALLTYRVRANKLPGSTPEGFSSHEEHQKNSRDQKADLEAVRRTDVRTARQDASRPERAGVSGVRDAALSGPRAVVSPVRTYEPGCSPRTLVRKAMPSDGERERPAPAGPVRSRAGNASGIDRASALSPTKRGTAPDLRQSRRPPSRRPVRAPGETRGALPTNSHGRTQAPSRVQVAFAPTPAGSVRAPLWVK
jgi:hypothetical protein